MGWVDPDGCRKAKDALKAGKAGRPEQVFTRSLEEGARLGWGEEAALRGIQWRQEVGTGNEDPRAPGKGTDSLPWMLTPLGRGPGAGLSASKERGRAAFLVAQW